jgi:hypothetical protein
VAAPAAALAVAPAAAPPVRAAPAPASRVAAALLDQHLERGLAPSCRAIRRRAPRAHGNDLRAPGDDSQPGPSPTMRRQTGIDVLCAYPALLCEPDPRDLSTPAERHAGAPLIGQVFPPLSWTCGGLPGGVACRSARTATSGGGGGGSCHGCRVSAFRRWPRARGARGTWWCPARRRAAWRPGTHHGTSRPTALRSRSRARCPPCHAASWRPCISPTAGKATRSRRSKSVAAPPELVSACFQRPESVSVASPGELPHPSARVRR